MSLPLRIQASAQIDFLEAYQWYAARHSDVADQFEAELQRCFALAADHPLQFTTVIKDIRRIRVRHYPYNIYFQARPTEVLIVAIVHTRRSPKRWLDRI